MSIDLNKIKTFHEKMENNKWYDLETLKKKPNCLSEVKEVKDFFQKYSALDKKDMEQVISYKGHVHYYPWNIEITASSDGSKRGKHKKNGKDYNYKLGLPLTAETFPEYMEEVEDLEKEVGGERENNGKCSKNNLCQDCQKELKRVLGDCEDWEVGFKKKIEEEQLYTHCDGEGNRIKYSPTGGHNLKACPSGCGKMSKKTNDYGDETTLDHVCSKDNPRERERERERESILNYFKQHNIKSIKLENNKLVIEYNNSQTENKALDNQELQAIKSYAESLGVKQLSLKDLEKSNPSQTPKSNKILYWGLGIGGVLVVGIVAWLLVKNNNKSK